MADVSQKLAAMAFMHLGTMKSPQSAYVFEKNDANGSEMVLQFDGSVTISEAQFYLGGQEKRRFVCSVPNAEGDGWDAIGDETELRSVYCWDPVGIHYHTYELGIVSMDERAEVLEIVLLDPDGNLILPSNADDYPGAFDEQDLLIQPMNIGLCLMRFTTQERRMRLYRGVQSMRQHIRRLGNF